MANLANQAVSLPCVDAGGFTYNFANDGGAVGALNTPLYLPYGTKVRNVWFLTTATVTSGGAATITLSCAGAPFTPAIAIADIPAINGFGTAANIIASTTAGTTGQIKGASVAQGGQVVLNIGAAALTAGAFTCFIEYWK